MVRAPCCEKMGLKKGPWTPEEDKILVDYIQLHGHENWRKLPKLAGLLRCGKSCRLRWTNYLRPDIKRGNFNREEEDTIIQLHGMLGNRWSAIAARLPGRTDNEIKNVWHTHLKKRLVRDNGTPRSLEPVTESPSEEGSLSSLTVDCPNNDQQDCSTPVSPDQHCSSSISSVIAGDDQHMTLTKATSLVDNVLDMDESFWAEVLSAENPGREEEFWAAIETRDQQEDISSNLFEATDFWCDLLARAELPEVLDLSPEIMF